tara:strand:- start:1402 stop:2013 length:612 start_codon:yes stop_codon:yes gene_type:complete
MYKKNIAFCFDFDGTITKEEVLPLIAKEINLYDEFKVLTDATIRGEIPLMGSLKLRFKLLETVPLEIIQNVILKVKLHQKLVHFINQNANNCFIVTANMDKWLEVLQSKINCKFLTSKVKYHLTENKITHLEFIDKSKELLSIKKSFDKVVCIGEGMGDVGMFEHADVKIAYGAVHKPVSTLLEISNFYVKTEENLWKILNML